MSRFVFALVSLAVLAAVPRDAAAADICQGLIERYQFQSYAQWWGMLGHCKRPGGPTDPDAIFKCGWHQVPMIDQVPCLENELRGARYTAVAIDLVASANGKPTCAALTYKYTFNDFAWWRHALSLCTGPTPGHIFQCAFAQVPPVEQQECLKEVLATAPVTKAAIDDRVAASTSFTCTGMIDRYQLHDHQAWRQAFAPCKTGRGGPNDRAGIVACAISNLPPPDQADTCLLTYLGGAAVTRRMVAEVRAYNGVVGAVADHVSTAWFPGQEDCELPRDGSIPSGYYEPAMPWRLADSTLPYGNEGRVRSDLRTVARIADPVACALPLAAHAYAAAEDPANARRMNDLVTDAKAYADLAVTGRKAFDAFRSETRLEPATYCADLASQPIAAGCPPLEPVTDPAALNRGCIAALRRAYAVANHLRTGQVVTAAGPWWTTHHIPSFAYAVDRERKRRERADLGWIAVSGEDDLPHRPVNVPSTDDPQFDIAVVVATPLRFLGFEAPGVALPFTVNARAVIAQSRAAAIAMPPAPDFALRPDLLPSIPAGSEVLVFIHGMDSRAEEAGDITKALFARMAATDTQPASTNNVVVVTVDLPSSGYTDTVDYERISRLDAIGVPYGAAGFAASGRTPLLDFLEDFVVASVEELDRRTPFRTTIKAVMGGSLGGNLSFRLGRRPDVPWLPATVVWSPASIWNSMGDGSDATVHLGPYTAWQRAADRNASDPLDLLSWSRLARRAEFFSNSWDAHAAGIVIPVSQPETWTNDFYPCKQSAIVAARLDRHETYDARYLSWRWRLATEQLLYSHQTIDPDTGLRRYMSNDKRMLLACGFDDHVPYNHICPSTSDTAQLMTLTPGEAFILDDTGHEVASERPRYFAGLIDGFLGLR